MVWIKIFIVGWGILLAAVVLNVIAVRLGLATWYSFVSEVNKSDLLKSLQTTSILSKLFLFFLYPFALGLASYILLKILRI